MEIENMNEYIDNPEFIDSIDKFIKDNSKENEVYFVREMKKAKLLVPVKFKENQTLSPVVLKNSDNKHFIISFTDRQQLNRWSKKEIDTVTWYYDDLKGVILQSDPVIEGFVINPFGHNIIIDRNTINHVSSIFDGDEK